MVPLHGIVGHQEKDHKHEDECSYQIGDDQCDGIEVVLFEGTLANGGDGPDTINQVVKENGNGKEDEPQDEVLASNQQQWRIGQVSW